METYIKTIINGLKSWVTSRLSRLETSVSGSLADLTNKLTSLSNNVSKNTKDIAQLQTYEDETYSIANKAQTTADTAKSTANTAYTTANQAQSAADTAQTTADTAQTTADRAQSMADRAQSMADRAQSMADTAQTTANTAYTTANQAQSTANTALQKSGGDMTGPLRMNGNYVINSDGAITAVQSLGIIPKNNSQSFGGFNIVKDPDAKTLVLVDRDSTSDASAPSTIKFIANGCEKMNVEGIHTIQMNSPSGKKFDLTVSDDGTITTTEVTA